MPPTPVFIETGLKGMDARNAARVQAREELARKRREAEEAKAQQERDEAAALAERRAQDAAVAMSAAQKRAAAAAAAKEGARLAVMHYTYASLMHRGLLPWRRLVEQRRLDEIKATRFAEDMLAVSTWRSWTQFVVERRRHKRARAEALLWNILRRKDHRVVRQGWARWTKLTFDLRARGVAVAAQHRYHAVVRHWRAWQAVSKGRRADLEKRAAAVVSLSAARAVRRGMGTWRAAKASRTKEAARELALERERERTWSKVRGWLGE